jgi:hypothetical protein
MAESQHYSELSRIFNDCGVEHRFSLRDLIANKQASGRGADIEQLERLLAEAEGRS